MKRNKKIFNRDDFACKPLLGGVPEIVVRQERYLDGSCFRWGKTSLKVRIRDRMLCTKLLGGSSRLFDSRRSA